MRVLLLLSLLACDPKPMRKGECVVTSERWVGGQSYTTQTCAYAGYFWDCAYIGEHYVCDRKEKLPPEAP
jgi:hypothetical protein